MAVLGFNLPFTEFLPITEKNKIDRNKTRAILQIPAGGKLASWDVNEFVDLFMEKTNKQVSMQEKSSKSESKSLRVPNSFKRQKKYRRLLEKK